MAQTKQQDLGGVIVLENFSKGSLFKRETNGEDRIHRIINGSSYLFKQIDNSYISDVSDTAYPLISPLKEQSISFDSDKGYTASFLIPNNTNDDRILYIATSKGDVLAFKDGQLARDMGNPSSLTSYQNETTLASYTNKLFWINPSKTKVYTQDETSTSGSWGNLSETFISPKFGLQFSVYFYIADKEDSSNNYRNKIKVFTTGLTKQGEFDIGSGWDIQDIANNNNRYLVLIANPFNVYTKQYAFLWDGSYQNRYFHAIQLPGIYLGSVNYLGAFIMFLKVGKSINVYELSGYSLRYIDTFPKLTIEDDLLPQYRFSVYGNYVVWQTQIEDLGIKGLVLYNILEGETLFLTTDNLAYGNVAVLDLNQNLKLFYTDKSDGNLKYRMLIPTDSFDDYIQSETQPFKQLSDDVVYKSNVVNLFRRAEINKIEVFLDSIPSNANQNYTIEIAGTNTRENTTATNSIQITQNSQAGYNIFSELGVIGDKFEITVKQSNDGSYKGGIGRILIYYTYLD